MSTSYSSCVGIHIGPHIYMWISTSVLSTTKKLNAQFRRQNHRGTLPKKSQSWKKSARTSSPPPPPPQRPSGPPSNVCVVQIASPFCSLSCSNLQIARQSLHFCSSHDSRVGFSFFTQVQTPVTLCCGELWSILVVRLAHSADLRYRLRHVPSAPSIAYSTGCSPVVTHPGTDPARRCLTSVI